MLLMWVLTVLMAIEFPGYLLIRQAGDDQPQHLELTPAERFDQAGLGQEQTRNLRLPLRLYADSSLLHRLARNRWSNAAG